MAHGKALLWVALAVVGTWREGLELELREPGVHLFSGVNRMLNQS